MIYTTSDRSIYTPVTGKTRDRRCLVHNFAALPLNVTEPVAIMLRRAEMTRQRQLSAQQLTNTSSVTLADYNENAASFWEGTREHDVSQNRDALITHLGGTGPYRILDFGCGPGRDLMAFKQMGHEVIGLDGAQEFVDLARKHSGCEVWHQDFLSLQLPEQYFDGIFANASLFHVPSQELPRVLSQLWHALKVGGVLFSSNPRGDNQEGWSGKRYGAYYDYVRWHKLVTAAGFTEITHYYRPPGLPRQEQPWLASVWRK